MPEYPEHHEYGADVTHINHDDMNSSVLVGGKVVKKFRGESAWSNAARHAGDLALQRQFAAGENPFVTDIFNDRRGRSKGRTFNASSIEADPMAAQRRGK